MADVVRARHMLHVMSSVPATLAAVVWHFWIGVALAIPGVLMVVATAVGYVVKVLGPKYAGRTR